MRTFVVLVGMLAAGTAHAQEALEGDPTQAPGFTTMLRQDGVSRIGADVSYFFLEGDADVTLMRFDLHGQFIDPATGVGGYAQLPITYASSDADTETVLGGGEVGVFYIPKLSSPGVGVVLRGGLTLPTVDDDDPALLGFVATYLRPTDLYAQLPRAMSLRLSVSPMIRTGHFFARLDAGLDVNVWHDGNGDNADPAILINFAGGFDLGSAAIMGELTTLAGTGDGGDTLTAAALSARFNAGAVLPYVALLIPVDDDVSDIFDMGLMVGLDGRL